MTWFGRKIEEFGRKTGLFGRKERLIDQLLAIDYLVFSPHKTGTQTLITTLNANGFKSMHCHHLSNIGVETRYFTAYLQAYKEKNKRRLNVITVFREPMDRHMSSFFQGYGTRPLRLNQMQSETETIIHRYSIEQLREQYVQELADTSLIGYPEALHEMFEALNISAADLVRQEDKPYSYYESDLIRLYAFRFDELFGKLEERLAAVTETPIQEVSTNLSDTKWYRDKYKEFRRSVRLPDNVIEKVYNEKRDLVEYFYGEYPEALTRAREKFGGGA